MNNTQIKHALLLLLTAAIWGVAFSAQSKAMDYMGPYTFNAIRFTLGGAVLLPVILIKDASGGKKREKSPSGSVKPLIIGGLLCGAALFTASTLQQAGIIYTDSGKAGFLTALYIVIVPILGLLLGKKPSPVIWLGVAFATAGLYLLCVKEGFSLEKGDALLIGCALVFSVHILIIDAFSPKADGVKLSCIQFFISGALSAILMLIFEKPVAADIIKGAVPLLYAGIMSCGVAYTLQIIGQKRVSPAAASLILSLESVFAVLSGWIFLSEKLSLREISGCVLVFAAIIIAQLPSLIKKKA